MGGGGAVRAAAKVAGVGVINGGLRGVPSMPPVEQTVRSASRPASAILSSSSSEAVKPAFVDASAAHAPAAWDDWEFAEGENEFSMASVKPMPRVVFEGVPSMQETKEATTDLKDALEKVYLSSPKSTGSEDPFAADSVSALCQPASETKSCTIFGATAASVPKPVMQVFKFFSASPEAQTVVASIAADPNVWNAMMDNPVLKDFIQSQKRNDEFKEMRPAKQFEELSESSQTGKSEKRSLDIMDLMQNVKLTVLEMVSNVSHFFQNIFGFSATENNSSDASGNTKATSMDWALGGSLMGLVLLVSMVVVLKRV